jgi:hypothetical protein
MTPLADQIQFLSYVRYKKQDSCKVTIEEKTKCIYHKESAKTQKEQENRIGRIAFGGRIRIYFFILPPKAILPILFSSCLCLFFVVNVFVR